MNLSSLNGKLPLEAALYYAEKLGWPVFPLHTALKDDWIEFEINDKTERILKCSCQNERCGRNTGKHPRTSRGLLDATVDAKKIREWWTTWPNANIGIRMGETRAALDADPGHGGLKSLQEVLAHSPNLKDTVIATTGGEGFHYLMKVPLAAGKFSTRTNVWPGIDIRGDGGYIVVSPSLHRSGRRYLWADEEAEIQEIDLKLLEKLRRQLKEDRDLLLSESSVNIPEGQRNDSLFRIACQKCALQWGFQEALSHLNRQNHERCDPPLEKDEVEAIVERAYHYSASYIFSDVGNAERLRDLHGQNLRYSSSLHWLLWEDGHWAQISEEDTMALAMELSKQMYALAKQHDDEALLKWARRTQSANSLSSMLRLLRSHVLIETSAVNQHSLWLPLINGVYEIDAGIFRTPRREDLILKRAPVTYDETADCPIWKKSLLRWMGGNVEMMHFLQRCVGYFLTGDIRHHALFILWGAGANGKSTFTRVIEAMLGQFGIAMSTDMLLRYAKISKEQEGARLFGTRLAICSESPENATLDIEIVKSLTGGDRVRAKIVYREPFDFDATHKILLHTNEKPKLTYNDYAAWRRIILIPWEERIPEKEQDAELPRRLLRELPGILNWALQGARDWYSSGDLGIPQYVREATKMYRKEQDQIGIVLDEIAEKGPNDRASKHRCRLDLLFRRYVATCFSWGWKPKARGVFYDYLNTFEGVRIVRDGNVPWVVGLRIPEDGGITLDR